MQRIPQIKRVTPLDGFLLRVCFQNGVEKIYDCAPLLSRPQFQLLKTPAFFRSVRVDIGGYGVSWNDDLDLSEYELWTNGRELSAVSGQLSACADG